MQSITESLQRLMSTMWSSPSTTTDALPTQSPSLGVAANQASTILSMSETEAPSALPSTSISSTESAPNSGSTTFTARLRNIFNGIREKCSSAFATIRTNVASAFTRVVTWFSNLRGGNRDETEVREFSSDRPSSNPLIDPNAGQVAHTTGEADQRTSSANLLAEAAAEVAEMGLEIRTGDFSAPELHSDGNESRDRSEDPSLSEGEGENHLLHFCTSHGSERAQVVEEAHVSEKAPLPAADKGRADELLADAHASLDAIAERAGGIITFSALEEPSVPLIQEAQARTFAEPSGRRSPSAPLFPNDTERFIPAEPFIRRSSFADVAAPEGEQARAGRRRSPSLELELRDFATTTSKMEDKPSKAAATSPSKGGAKQKARKK